MLSKYENGGKIGVEKTLIPEYQVSFIRELEFQVVDVSRKLMGMRYIKDNEELKLMEKSGQLVSQALNASLDACQEGITEIEMDAKGNNLLFEEIAERNPDSTLDLVAFSPSEIERTIMPHIFSNTRKLKNGDILIHSRQVALNGYRAELERTIVLGDITDEQKKLSKQLG